MDAVNPELRLAEDFVVHTGCSIFLTGRAGTGKTTFLQGLKKKTAKRLIVTAPTGVAAINAGGVTLHSFFQLPFGPFVPGYDLGDGDRQRRFNKEKINIIKSLDLLVIDEISMVRADVLDGVDEILRRYRHGNQPFGGVQLLMIGDLHQLPPVVKNEEWSILRDHYASAYFFNSHALGRTELVTLELRHIYRQSDSRFIRLLNRVRENRLDSADLDELNTRCIPGFTPPENQNVITLCTHNNRAESINHQRLSKLGGKIRSFTAKVSGDFPEYAYPTSSRLDLKIGAQVMFVRNDPGPEKQYFNGKIGRVSRIDQDTVFIQCPGENKEIATEPISWENIRYSLDPETKAIDKKTIGEFTQYPLKPAWAITIHKSQGLTFDRAMIDAGSAFTHGQVYVALSRCRTMDGLFLSSPIPRAAIQTDPLVVTFCSQARQKQPNGEQLQRARIAFQQRLLLECFDFNQLRVALHRFVGLVLGNGPILEIFGGSVPNLEQEARSEVCVVGENFTRQLQGLLSVTTLPEADATIRERVSKASVYFGERLRMLANRLDELRLETDNKELRKRVDKNRRQLRKEIEILLAAVQSCQNGFSPEAYLHTIALASIDAQPTSRKKDTDTVYTEADVEHPEIYRCLKEWRAEKAATAGLPHYRIIHQRILIRIAIVLPDTSSDLLKIPGIGPQTLEKYGNELISIVSQYREKHGIKEVHLPEPMTDSEDLPKTETKPSLNTREISLDMFRQGLSISEIAKERGLVTSTIEGHLATFIRTGKLTITDLVSPEKQKTIEKQLAKSKVLKLGEIKKELGEEYTFGEIKMVMAHLDHAASEESTV